MYIFSKRKKNLRNTDSKLLVENMMMTHIKVLLVRRSKKALTSVMKKNQNESLYKNNYSLKTVLIFKKV